MPRRGRHQDPTAPPPPRDPPEYRLQRLRIHSQGVIATGVLIGATLMGWAGVIGSEAVVAVYSAALGAVAGRAVDRADSTPSITSIHNPPDESHDRHMTNI